MWTNDNSRYGSEWCGELTMSELSTHICTYLPFQYEYNYTGLAYK